MRYYEQIAAIRQQAADSDSAGYLEGRAEAACDLADQILTDLEKLSETRFGWVCPECETHHPPLEGHRGGVLCVLPHTEEERRRGQALPSAGIPCVPVRYWEEMADLRRQVADLQKQPLPT